MPRKRTTPAPDSAPTLAPASPSFAVYRAALEAVGLTAAEISTVADAYTTPRALLSADAEDYARNLPRDVARKVAALALISAEARADRTAVGDPQAAAAPFFEIGAHRGTQERFHVMTLDVRSKAIGVYALHVGSLASVDVSPSVILRRAILDSAHAIIVAHNHPSGNTSPSEADDLLTRRVALASRVMGIKLVDHLVMTPACDVYSYAAHGRDALSDDDATILLSGRPRRGW